MKTRGFDAVCIVGIIAVVLTASVFTLVSMQTPPPAVPMLVGHEEPRSGKWEAVRKEHLLKEPVCQYCGSKESLQVHHKRPFHLDPTLELDPTNLITLCGPGSKHDCHLLQGHLGDYKLWNPRIREDCNEHQLERQAAEERIGK